ncbi:hypothetical protein TorRG33x02_018340 [Trema orientale]|uniref:Uncharacterized protein n=1 Tax=Trema orientale TaxID=63057 RepID=A0A2P5FW78_TREOI|nr:hypothetical protein TorRG33x02_018340 [Trema orientale]
MENVAAMIGDSSIAYSYGYEGHRNIHFSGDRSSPAVSGPVLSWTKKPGGLIRGGVILDDDDVAGLKLNWKRSYCVSHGEVVVKRHVLRE